MTTDPSEMIKSLLDTNWNSANTDSRKPDIVTSQDEETVNTRQNDVIKVYEQRPRTKRRIDHRYDYATYISAVTLQVDVGFTPDGVTLPAHGANVLEEIERIIQAGRSNPDEYWNLLETDTFQWQHQFKEFMRSVTNVNCKRIVQQIPGTV